jgi:capsule polysaccharide export protein KpsE/RkpR
MIQLKLLTATLFFLFLGLASLQAQEAVLASGGEIDDSGGSVSYSVGQLTVASYTSANGSVNPGVQQPFEVTVISGIENKNIHLNVNVLAYPNPAIDFLIIRVESQAEQLSASLFDISGTLLRSTTVENNQAIVDVQGLAKATYLLRISGSRGHIKTFQIIKK